MTLHCHYRTGYVEPINSAGTVIIFYSIYCWCRTSTDLIITTLEHIVLLNVVWLLPALLRRRPLLSSSDFTLTFLYMSFLFCRSTPHSIFPWWWILHHEHRVASISVSVVSLSSVEMCVFLECVRALSLSVFTRVLFWVQLLLVGPQE